MMNFQRSARNRGGKNFDRRFSTKPVMHKATCDECGDFCEVPFKPSGSKPVYCHNCFKKNGSKDAARFEEKVYRSRDFTRDSKPAMHKAICDECGDFCEVPFKPNSNKPVFCKNCFKKPDSSNSSDSSSNFPLQLKEALDILNIKLDRILKILILPPQESAPEKPHEEKRKISKAKKLKKA